MTETSGRPALAELRQLETLAKAEGVAADPADVAIDPIDPRTD
jgi:hypothetical protein